MGRKFTVEDDLLRLAILDLGSLFVIKGDIDLEFPLAIERKAGEGEEFHSPRIVRRIKSLKNPSQVVILGHDILLDMGTAKESGDLRHVEFHYFFPFLADRF